jgi:hypothetical protein
VPGTFTYDESTNTVVVTGGTSGSPADFASFVTADRAGTGTSLLAAIAGSATNTLTYQVRPVELLAIIIKCIVAAKTTETDYIFITGTDAWDAAQTESINVSAGNASYTTTKRWRTITNIDCSDSSTGGGTVWADGTIAVTQDIWGVIWSVGTGQYRIAAILEFGDASTATYFYSSAEEIYFLDSMNPIVTAYATLQLGQITAGGNGISGSFISYYPSSTTTHQLVKSSGTLLFYGSILCNRRVSRLNIYGTFTIRDSHYQGNKSSTSLVVFAAGSIVDYKNFTLSSFGSLAPFVSPSAASESMRIFNVTTSITGYTTASFTELFCADFTTAGLTIPTASTITLVDPKFNLTGFVAITNNSGVARENFTVLIKVVDAVGNPLESVTVILKDKTTTQIFSVSTDVNGDITKQTIESRNWTTTSAILTENFPFSLTISKAGYQTLVLENITVDAPIKWHLELQPVPIHPHYMIGV